ncbi:MAG: hypothetical protein AAB434_04795 [Planctomycetota bacterium]
MGVVIVVANWKELWPEREATFSPSAPDFQFEPGASVEEVKKALGEPDLDEVDESLKYDGVVVSPEEAGLWRDLLYLQMHDVSSGLASQVSVNLRFQYRSDTGKIWSVRIADPARVMDVFLDEIPMRGTIDDCVERLGEPTGEGTTAPIVGQKCWIRGRRGYRVDYYTENHADPITPCRAGQLQMALVCDLDLAPRGFEKALGGGSGK